jgi:hypothetical protein
LDPLNTGICRDFALGAGLAGIGLIRRKLN